MALTLPASFQQLKDLPLRVECTPEQKSALTALFASGAELEAADANAFYRRADELVVELIAYLDAQVAQTTQLRFQAGDTNALKQKLLADPRRAVDQTISAMKQRVSNDRSDWSRRLTKQLKDIQDTLHHELNGIPVDVRPESGRMLVTAEATWRSQFARWMDTTTAKWSGHLGQLLQSKTLDLLRGDLDQLGQQVSANLVPTLPAARVPVATVQLQERVWEVRFDPPGLMGTVFDTFKNGLNTVAMLAGMIVIPVVGSLMNESPVHVRAIVMSATIMPVVLFAAVQGVRTRKRLMTQLTDKARGEITKGLDVATRGLLERFKVDAERYCAEYGQQALASVLQQVEPFVTDHFQSREASAAAELAAAQIQVDRLQEQASTLRSVRGALVNQVQVDVRRRLNES
ncbi:MAG: hypothetical protein R3B40_31555 [Polyangiales bacterium]|nr:hypothetical protein [Myxococcales bacterium]